MPKNRPDIRIGSAAIYSMKQAILGVIESLILCLEDGRAGFYTAHFVQLAAGKAWRKILNPAARCAQPAPSAG